MSLGQNSNGISLELARSKETLEIKGALTNVVKITNNSDKDRIIKVGANVPGGWRLVSSYEDVSLKIGETKFFPIRVLPDKRTPGNTNYPITVVAYEGGFSVGSITWLVEVYKHSNWYAFLPVKDVYFGSHSDIGKFMVEFENLGNAEENITVKLHMDRKLVLVDSAGNSLPNASMASVSLGIKEKLTKTFFVKLDNGHETKGRGSNTDLASNPVPYSVKIKAANSVYSDSTSREWSGQVNFHKLNSRGQVTDNGHSHIPFSIDLTSFNTLSNFTNLIVNFQGDAELTNNRIIRMQVQNVFSDNFFNASSYQGTYKYLEYSTSNYRVQAGNIGANMEQIVTGVGLRGHYTFQDKYKVSALALTRNLGALGGRVNAFGGSTSAQLNKNLNVETFVINTDDSQDAINATTIAQAFKYRINKDHHIFLRLAYSFEKHSFKSDSIFELDGYGSLLRYSGRYKNHSFGIQGRLNTRNFSSQYRGAQTLNSFYRYNFNPKLFIRSLNQINFQDPSIYAMGVQFADREFKFNSYEVGIGMNKESGTYIFGPKVIDRDILAFKAFEKGMTFLYRSKSTGSTRFFTNIFSGYADARDYEDLRNFFVVRAQSTIKYKSMTGSIRYFYGPFSTNEYQILANNGLNPQALVLSMYSTHWYRNNRFNITPLLSYNYQTLYGRYRIGARPIFRYYSKKNFEFRIIPEFIFINQFSAPLFDDNPQIVLDENIYPDRTGLFFIHFGMKKDFGIPIPGRKLRDLKVTIYKDLNGDNIKQKNEEACADVIVTMGTNRLITNRNGEVVFRNLKEGTEIKLSTRKITRSEGWFGIDSVKFILNGDKDIDLPMKRGVRLTGSIILEKAKYSTVNTNIDLLSGIRVTAVDALGRSYYALTDQNGEFEMYIPSGIYTVIANEDALNNQFEFINGSFEVDVSKVPNYHVSFFAGEKKRKIKIKKF